MIDLWIARFCAVECELQRSGAYSVSNMLNAWEYAQQIPSDWWCPKPLEIRNIAKLVEPDANADGYRKVNVEVRGDLPPAWYDVGVRMHDWFEDARFCSAEESFEKFERIHPFVDGNGRTGVIVYNILKGTLDSPVWPPDPFGDPRRVPGWGAPWLN